MSTHLQHPQVTRRERVGHRRARRPRLGGSRGNELLTSANAVLLLALLAVQGVTILALDSMIHIHLFVGVVLLGPVALKLASTGYRFARYYSGAREYRAAGPPPTVLRAIAPVFVLATAGLFASGVAMLLRGEGGGFVGSVHVTSFWVWLACLAIHIAFNGREVITAVRSQWLARARERIAGAELRAALMLASALGGVLLALSLLSKITGWHGDAG
jgi:hypothetical protein